jgi:hypothetical protein
MHDTDSSAADLDALVEDLVATIRGTVKSLVDKGFRGSLGSGWVAVALWSGGCWSQSGDLVPGGESGGHLVSVLGCGESVAAGSEVR